MINKLAILVVKTIKIIIGDLTREQKKLEFFIVAVGESGWNRNHIASDNIQLRYNLRG